MRSLIITNNYVKNCNLRLCRKDVRLPVQLQRAMAAEAEAAREARAKVNMKVGKPIKSKC